MKCPYCKGIEMIEKNYDYHHAGGIKPTQPMNDMLSILYECPECKTTVETSQQVRIVSPKEVSNEDSSS